MHDAYRPSTKKSYSTYLKKWSGFCVEKKINQNEPTLAQGNTFLSKLEDTGVKFGAVNTARSAMSAVLPFYEGGTFGNHQLTSVFCKSVYERNPPAPRYAQFWDVKKVFNLFKSEKWCDPPLELLGKKVVMLILLTTGRRGQIVKALDVHYMEFIDDTIVFYLQVLEKSNHVGDARSTVTLRSYPKCKHLCVVSTVKKYISMTKDLRKGAGQLLISSMKPHLPISRDSVSRWTMQVMQEANIDVEKYKGHTPRGVFASHALPALQRKSIPINCLMRHCGWKSEESFANHYHKPIEREVDIAELVLDENA